MASTMEVMYYRKTVPWLSVLCIYTIRHILASVNNSDLDSLQYKIKKLDQALPRQLLADLSLDNVFHGEWKMANFHKSYDYVMCLEQ